MPDDPVFLVATKGGHPFRGRDHAAAGEALLAGGAQHLTMCGWRGEVCPGSPSSLKWCDSRFCSAEVASYWLRQLLLGSGLGT